MAVSTSGPDAGAPRIGEWITEALSLFGREWVVWLAQGAIYMVLSAVPLVFALVVAWVPLARAGFLAASSPSAAEEVSRAGWTSLGWLFAGLLLVLVVSSVFFAGMIRTAARQIRGERISVGQVFGAIDSAIPLTVAGFFIIASFLAGLVFCCAPGFFLIARWHLVFPLIAEGRCGLVEAFRRSWRATRGHTMMHVIWVILWLVILNAGSAVLVGTAATVPLALLMATLSCRDELGLPTAAGTDRSSRRLGAGAVCGACGGPVPPRAPVCPACGTPHSGEMQ